MGGHLDTKRQLWCSMESRPGPSTSTSNKRQCTCTCPKPKHGNGVVLEPDPDVGLAESPVLLSQWAMGRLQLQANILWVHSRQSAHACACVRDAGACAARDRDIGQAVGGMSPVNVNVNVNGMSAMAVAAPGEPSGVRECVASLDCDIDDWGPLWQGWGLDAPVVLDLEQERARFEADLDVPLVALVAAAVPVTHRRESFVPFTPARLLAETIVREQ